MTPILKNPSLTSEFSNLRPISNLQFISKLTERTVFDQLQTRALYPVLQSAYRKSHSTETALIKVQNDILMNRQHVTLLVLLDLIAAFDAIDHQVLINRLRLSFVIRGSRLIFLTGHNVFPLKISSLRVVICPVVYPKDHASVRCYSQCMRASSLISSKVIFLGHMPRQMTLNCIYHLSLILHLLKATQWTLWNAVLVPSDVG